MPRQIVPVTDVAAILLTQDEGDLRYLPLSYTPPPVDLSLYYTKVQSDARYEPIDTMYTKAESDAKYLTQVLADARYSLLAHNHDSSYSLLTHNHDAAYSPTAHNHDSVYINAAGDDTMTGVLTSGGTITGYLSVWGGWKFQDEGGNLVWRNPAGDQNRLVFWGAGHTTMSGSLDAGTNISTSGGSIFASGAGGCMYAQNLFQAGYGAAVYTFFKGNGVEKHGAGALDIWAADGQNIQLNPGGAVVHPPNESVNLGYSGLRWVKVWAHTVDTTTLSSPGQMNVSPGFHFVLNTVPTGGWNYFRSASHNWFDGDAQGQVSPEIDNKLVCGGVDGHRWKYVSAVNGGIQTSNAVYKKNYKPLDPVACTQAVLETDWVSFEYLPTPPPPAEEGETPNQRIAKLGEYQKEIAKDAFVRKQNGYVLGHPTHKTHGLFGLADREHASPSADLGILACALQAALQRIAALESLQGVAP